MNETEPTRHPTRPPSHKPRTPTVNSAYKPPRLAALGPLSTLTLGSGSSCFDGSEFSGAETEGGGCV